MAIEPYLSGSYQKFNSNGGYENDLSKLLPAFCHWTWEISGHKFMVRQQDYLISCKCTFAFNLTIIWSLGSQYFGTVDNTTVTFTIV